MNDDNDRIVSGGGAPPEEHSGTGGATAENEIVNAVPESENLPSDTVNAAPEDSIPPSEVAGDDGSESVVSGEREAARKVGTNSYFQRMFDRNYLEYAAYAIKDRAIPNVDDGLKPVQRRILWAMHKIDDGRTHKAAFVVGEVMGKYHPHGDASIGGALVVLANKEYFIKKQGNFGNIFTGSGAAAVRYIECGLSALGREVLFNDDITEMVDTYDGRNLEPVTLPVKIPALLMLGSEGIAVGMATRIMPHNFVELLEAQIAVLEGREFTLYPDFLQGGIMDVSEYADGNGKIILRARIEIRDRKLYIREIPATTTTESLIASIEREAEKGRIKIAAVNDYTSKEVEIEVVPTRGYDPEKALNALYMYTDCAVSISPNLTVIKDKRPCVMSVTEVIQRNTSRLLEYLRRELEIELERQNELFHAKTLAQIFFENRIYKRIEECGDEAAEYREVHSGLAPFRHMLKRDVTDEDVDKLLALPVRRISRFDIAKNQTELRTIEKKIAEVERHLKQLKKYAIDYLRGLIEKYGPQFPRRTEIETLEKIDRKAAALSNIRVGWDRKNCYVGTAVKSDDYVMVSEFDQLLCVERSGRYRIVNIPDKMFVDRLYEFRKQDATAEFGVIYSDRKSGKFYGKRSRIEKFITDREYQLCPPSCRLELLTPCANAVYVLKLGGKKPPLELNLMDLPVRSPRARGILIAPNVQKITFSRYLTEEELAAALAVQQTAPSEEDEETENVGGGEPHNGAETDGAAEKKEADSVKTEPKTLEPEKISEPAEPAARSEAEPEKISEPAEPAAPELLDVPPDDNDGVTAEPPKKRTRSARKKTISSKAAAIPAATETPEPVNDGSTNGGTGDPTDDGTRNSGNSDADDGKEGDDFGIVQPEFGF